MRLAYLYAKLSQPPYLKSFDAIGRMTLAQVDLMLTDPEDLASSGSVAVVLTRKQRFMRWAMYQCIPDHVAEQLYAEGYED